MRERDVEIVPHFYSMYYSMLLTSKYQFVRLKALKGITSVEEYFLSKYFKREYLKQTSFQSKGALVQGLQALGRISSVTPESSNIIRIVLMISSKAPPVSDSQNVEQGHMAYDVKKIRQETSLWVLHQEKDHVCELYL